MESKGYQLVFVQELDALPLDGSQRGISDFICWWVVHKLKIEYPRIHPNIDSHFLDVDTGYTGRFIAISGIPDSRTVKVSETPNEEGDYEFDVDDPPIELEWDVEGFIRRTLKETSILQLIEYFCSTAEGRRH